MSIQPLANPPFTGVLNSGSYTFKSFCENLSNPTCDKSTPYQYGKLATLRHDDYCICDKRGTEAKGEFLQGEVGEH